MANVEHKNLVDPELHEPKGASTAAAGQVYVADGAGSGAWESAAISTGASAGEVYIADGAGSGSFQVASPYGAILYNDLAGAGTTLTTPTAYTLISAAASATDLVEFTTNGAGRLTYTGANARHVFGTVDMSFKHSVGTQDVYFAVHKNGSLLGTFEAVIHATGTVFERMSFCFDLDVVTNDYVEIVAKAASGNVVIHSMYLKLMGVPG